MQILRSTKVLVLLAGLVVSGVAAAVAVPAVISQQVFAEGTTLNYRFEKRLADGFDSGWHIHPGLSIIQVQEGSLQVYREGSCTPRTVAAGDTAIEAPWEPIRVVATGRVRWTTSIIVSGGSPLAVPLSTYTPDHPNPCPGT